MEEYIIDDEEAAEDFESLLEGLSGADMPYVNNGMVLVPGIGSFEFTDKYSYFLDRLTISEKKDKNYLIVLSDSDRASMEAHIVSFEEHAYDVEATGLNVRKDRVIGFSICGKAGTAFYYPLYQWLDGELQPIQENIDKCTYYLELLATKKLMMWNGSYDIRITKNDLGVDLVDALYIEGMLIKHTLQEEGPFGLKDTGIELQAFIGLNVEEDANKEQIALKANVAKNGGETKKTNYQMYMADLSVLGIYGAADADLTLRICQYYLQKLKKEGLSKFFFTDEVMPLYRELTIHMEESGVCMDMALLRASKTEIEEDIKVLSDNVINSLRDLPEFSEWLVASAEKSFPAKPTGNFAQRVVTHFELDLPTTPAGKYSTSAKFVRKLPDSLAKSFLLGEDLDYTKLNLQDISINLWKEKNGSLINISSKKQMGEIVFERMGVKPLSKTDKGAPQFNATLVEHLASDGFEWAKHLKDYNKLIKIRGTYIDRFLDREEDGKYYFSYKQHGTISGRYGSDAQQLPRPMEVGQDSEVVLKYNNRIRKFFIPSPGNKMIICDQSSLEPRVFASVSGDPDLIKVFTDNEDLYSRIAIQVFKLEGVSANKGDDNFLKKVYPELRQRSKAIALAIPYGATNFQLSKSLDISMDEADDLINSYLGSFPKLKDWMDSSKEQAQEKGFVSTKLGRVCHLPMVKDLFSIYGDKLLDFKYRARINKRKGKEEVKSMYLDYKGGVNRSRNFQIQGLAASIMNRSGIEIMRDFERINGRALFQIHDEYVFEVEDEFVDEALEIIQRNMETAVRIDTPLIAIPEIATNFGDGHD